MRTSNSIMLLSICCLAIGMSHADSVGNYREAQRIVVITDVEGIHYAHGCAFYELRDLLVDGTSNVTDTGSMADTPLYEIRVLGKFGKSTVYVGDHWMGTPEGASLLPSATYDRVVELIEMRKGQGVAKAKISKSIQRALDRILDPVYVEENRCSSR